MKVAVIGASGGMGSFFVRYFLSRGDRVTGADTKQPALKHPRFAFVRSNTEAVAGAAVVLVATPVDRTVDAAAEVAGSLAKGSTLVEITSVKGKVLGELRKVAKKSGFNLLSLHPLFGPSLSKFPGMKVCVIRTGKGALQRAKALFPQAELIEMAEEEHDRTMGLILSATHLLNIAYAGVVSKHLTPQRFRKVQTPTSGVQLTLAEGILSQDPSLYSNIQMQNEYSAEFAAALINELTQMLRYIEERDKKGFEARFRQLARRYSGDSRDALDLVYQAFEKPLAKRS